MDTLFLYLFFFSRYADLRYLHSFPTRRSSDLSRQWVVSISASTSIPSRNRITISATVARSPTSSDRASNVILRSEEHTSELQSRENLVCRLLLEKKKLR